MLADEADNPGFLLLLEQVPLQAGLAYTGKTLNLVSSVQRYLIAAFKAEKEVRGGRPDLATIYLDKVFCHRHRCHHHHHHLH